MIKKVPMKVAQYRIKKEESSANRELHHALKYLFEGRLGNAQKAARRAMAWKDNASLAALIGALAAHRMRRADERDTWLNLAKEDAQYKVAALMLMIETWVDDHQPQKALAAVEELKAHSARHLYAQRLALKAYQQSNDWPEVLKLVRSLDKFDALHPVLSTRLRELAYEDSLLSKINEIDDLRFIWKNIPKDDRVRISVALNGAKAHYALNLHEDVKKIIEEALQKIWDAKLLEAYRHFSAIEGSPVLLGQIEKAEEWLSCYPTDAELNLTLGSLCLKQKLWGKAKQYIQGALNLGLNIKSEREANLLLAQLHESLGEMESAHYHYRLSALK
jgi:HemY protein